MKSQRIGMLGAGNMASALIRGLLASKSVTADQIVASDVRADHLKELETEYGIKTFSDNRRLAAASNLVVLAVKPQVVDRVLDQMADAFAPDTLLVSIAAGVPIRSLEARLPEHVRIVRAMPNTAAIALAGAMGRSVVLDESLIDAVTGLSGSGPAYVMVIIEALADGGVKVGLHRDTALLLAAQTVYGSAKLLLETGEHPGRLKDMVTSPGGTAIAGLHTLESGGLRRTLIDAVDTATKRAIELGEAMAKKLDRS
jgi:pyrroline-5-carboxylate reductase